MEIGLLLAHRAVRLIAEVSADRNPVSFERKFTSTADEGDSEAFFG